MNCPGDMQLVYLLFAGGFVKAGRARDIAKRISLLQTGCPLEIEPVTAAGPFDKKSANAFEREMHARMAPLRSFGEWFSCTVEQATSLFAILASSCIGVRFSVFDNQHAETVRACFERERRCRDRNDPESGILVSNVSRVLSCFQSGDGRHIHRRQRSGVISTEHDTQAQISPDGLYAAAATANGKTPANAGDAGSTPARGVL